MRERRVEERRVEVEEEKGQTYSCLGFEVVLDGCAHDPAGVSYDRLMLVLEEL